MYKGSNHNEEVISMVNAGHDVLYSRQCRMWRRKRSSDPEQTESLNEEGRGTSGTVIDLSKFTKDLDSYTAQDGDILTGTLGAKVLIAIAPKATITIRDVTIKGEDASVTSNGRAELHG